MERVWALLALPLLLGGCGAAETGTAAASGADSAAQQAAQARAREDRVRQQIDAAYQQADDQRRAAEKDADKRDRPELSVCARRRAPLTSS